MLLDCEVSLDPLPFCQGNCGQEDIAVPRLAHEWHQHYGRPTKVVTPTVGQTKMFDALLLCRAVWVFEVDWEVKVLELVEVEMTF